MIQEEGNGQRNAEGKAADWGAFFVPFASLTPGPASLHARKLAVCVSPPPPLKTSFLLNRLPKSRSFNCPLRFPPSLVCSSRRPSPPTFIFLRPTCLSLSWLFLPPLSPGLHSRICPRQNPFTSLPFSSAQILLLSFPSPFRALFLIPLWRAVFQPAPLFCLLWLTPPPAPFRGLFASLATSLSLFNLKIFKSLGNDGKLCWTHKWPGIYFMYVV